MSSRLRKAAGYVRRRLFPGPEMAAWRKIASEASGISRYTPGTIDVMGYRLSYVDLLTIAPQWYDTFVKNGQAFRSASDTPRIIDCGANIGIVTLYYKRVYPHARITAYEADPDIAAVLMQNIHQNGVNGVEIVSAAVWDENTQVSFSAEGSDAGAITSAYRGLPSRTVTIAAVRLRDILAAEVSVDLLKIDIEGAEHRVLADCEDMLYKVRAIALEIHNFDVMNRKGTETLELLTRSGFIYAHGGAELLPGIDAGEIRESPFLQPSTTWMERIYAWRA